MNDQTKPTLDEFHAFVKLLAGHDWYYDYSDDHSVWKKGQAQLDNIRRIAKSHPVYQQAYNVWAAYIRGGDATKVDAIAQRDAGIEAIRQQLEN